MTEEMNSMELFYLVLFSAIVLLAPMISTDLLLWLDHIVVRIVIVGFLFYIVKMNPMLGIFGLLAMAVLYIERNRRKVDRAMKKLERMDAERPVMATVEEATTPQSTVPVRSFDEPDEDEFSFLPKEDSFNDLNFDPVAPSINYKSTLSSIYPYEGSPSPSSTEELFEQMGVGHVPGVETLGNE
jgi:hypothetical protein